MAVETKRACVASLIAEGAAARPAEDFAAAMADDLTGNTDRPTAETAPLHSVEGPGRAE